MSSMVMTGFQAEATELKGTEVVPINGQNRTIQDTWLSKSHSSVTARNPKPRGLGHPGHCQRRKDKRKGW